MFVVVVSSYFCQLGNFVFVSFLCKIFGVIFSACVCVCDERERKKERPTEPFYFFPVYHSFSLFPLSLFCNVINTPTCSGGYACLHTCIYLNAWCVFMCMTVKTCLNDFFYNYFYLPWQSDRARERMRVTKLRDTDVLFVISFVSSLFIYLHSERNRKKKLKTWFSVYCCSLIQYLSIFLFFSLGICIYHLVS